MELFNLLAKLTLDTTEFEKGIDEAERDLDSIEAPDTKLELDNEDFNDGLEESQGLGDSFGSEMEKVFSGIKTALTVTGIASVIAGIVNGIKEAVDMTAQYGDEVDKGAKQLGISRKAYQEWDHALQQSGASIDDVKKGIQNMQLAIQAAKPGQAFKDAADQVDGLADAAVGLSKDAYEGLRDLGLLDDLIAHKFSSAEELMSETIKRLSEFDGTTDERGVIVRKLFGRGGDSLNALLDEGRAGIDALLAEADKLGLLMSDKEIDNAVAYGDALANLNSELNAVKMAFVSGIIPVLTTAVKWLTDFLAALNPRISNNSIADAMKNIDQEAKTSLASIEANEKGAMYLADKLIAMGDATKLTAEQQAEWRATAEALIQKIPTLSDIIDTDTGKIKGGTQALKENIKEWANLARQRAITDAREKKEAELIKANEDLINKRVIAVDKETEAYQAREDSLAKINKILTDNGYEALGANATIDDFLAMNQRVITDQPFNFNLKKDLAVAVSEWADANLAAEDATAEVQALDEELNKAQKDFQKWEATVQQIFGTAEASANSSKDSVNGLKQGIDLLPDSKNIYINTIFDEYNPFKKAIGDHYIPYDNFPALLHRGERVLTATENRRGEGGGGVDYSQLEDRIVASIQAGMENVTVRSYLNGKDITDETNRRNINAVKGRRFSK